MEKINIISNDIVEKITTESELPTSLYNPQIAEANIHHLLYQSFPDYIIPLIMFDEKEHVLQMKYCEKGTLSSIRTELMNDVLFLSIYFRVLWILYRINKKYPEFRHNDLHLNNIFLSYEPRDFIEIGNGKWKIPTFNYKVMLGDFDRSSITGLIDNYHIYYFQCFQPQLKYDSSTDSTIDTCVFTASFLAHFGWKLSKQLVNFISVYLYQNSLKECVSENYYVPPVKVLYSLPRPNQILFDSLLFSQFLNCEHRGKITTKTRAKTKVEPLVHSVLKESILVPHFLTDIRSHSQQYYELYAPKHIHNAPKVKVKPDFNDIKNLYIEITSTFFLSYSLKLKNHILYTSMVACEQFFRSQYVHISNRNHNYIYLMSLAIYIFTLGKELPIADETELLTPQEWVDTFLNLRIDIDIKKGKARWTGDQLLQCLLQYNWFRAFYIY